jgi:hypothetical protein
VNPLQHMKDANENILKVLLNNIQESVDFLEKCLDTLTHDICLPTSECFTNLSAETGGYDIVWERARHYDVKLIKALVSYDLGVFFFQQEKYGQSLKYLKMADELRKCVESGEVDFEYLSRYLSELKSYLLACGSMVDEEASGEETGLDDDFKRIVDFERKPEPDTYQVGKLIVFFMVRTDLIRRKVYVLRKLMTAICDLFLGICELFEQLYRKYLRCHVKLMMFQNMAIKFVIEMLFICSDIVSIFLIFC